MGYNTVAVINPLYSSSPSTIDTLSASDNIINVSNSSLTSYDTVSTVYAPNVSSNSNISGGQATDQDVESMLGSDDENGVEVSDETLGLFKKESGSEMENETSSVVELSAGDSINVIRLS